MGPARACRGSGRQPRASDLWCLAVWAVGGLFLALLPTSAVAQTLPSYGNTPAPPPPPPAPGPYAPPATITFEPGTPAAPRPVLYPPPAGSGPNGTYALPAPPGALGPPAPAPVAVGIPMSLDASIS